MDIIFEFNFTNIPEETKLGVLDALEHNKIFALQNEKGNTYFFIPQHNAINFGSVQQICPDRTAFQNVISMSLYSYRKFVPMINIKQVNDKFLLLIQ